MKVIDGNRCKEGGDDFRKKFGFISIQDYRSMMEENFSINQNKIKAKPQAKLELNLNEVKVNRIREENKNRAQARAALSRGSNKSRESISVKNNQLNLSTQISRLEEEQKIKSLTEINQPLAHNFFRPQKISESLDLKSVNVFNKNVLVNQYWGTQRGVEMIHKREIAKGFPLKHRKFELGQSHDDKNILVHCKDFKPPESVFRKREPKFKDNVALTLPFV